MLWTAVLHSTTEHSNILYAKWQEIFEFGVCCARPQVHRICIIQAGHMYSVS
jgi:hypothetical protein